MTPSSSSGRRVAGGDRRADQAERRGLRGQQVRRRRATAAQPDRATGERPARPLADLRLEQPATDEPGDRRRPVAAGQVRAGDALGRVRSGQLGQRGDLARSERPARHAIAGQQGRRRLVPGPRGADPALVARPGGRAQQRPLERDQAGGGQRPESPRSPARPSGAASDRAGRGPPASWSSRSRSAGVSDAPAPAASGRPRRQLGDQLEPLEHPRRQHRPEDERRRRQVVRGDPARERERRAAGSSGPSARTRSTIGLGVTPGDRGRLAEHDAERLAASELDEDRLAGVEVGERRRHEVRVGAVARPRRPRRRPPRPAVGPTVADRLVARETERHDQAPRRGPGASGGGGASRR